MKKQILLIALAFVQTIVFGQTEQEINPQTFFNSAFAELKNMLEGKDSLNYEKAVFITENAYYNNAYDYNEFSDAINFHIELIKSIAENARQANQEKFKTLKLYQQKMFVLNSLNWAIYKYLTDTITIKDFMNTHYKLPFNYSTEDPYGSTKWENTQVIHLLASNDRKGNCYALSTLFKIFSDRLNSDARLIIAPHHIYIQNRNEIGDYWNIDLATKTFPGDGSIQTLTYTTHELIMNGMSQRPLNDTDAVALNLIYLAKGFEHKFNDDTNDFLLKCADLAYKYDTLSLNALLLKAEVTENRLFAAMQKNKIKSVSQARANPQTQKLLTSYEKQLNNFYKLGYREVPKDIEHIILSAIQGNKDGYITTDKTPNPFRSIGQKQRYATLSWGLFDEMHPKVDTIQYFHASLNTKTKKIIEFLPIDTSNSYKVDPVIFAWSVDPLAPKYPGISPYAAFANNPILLVDENGEEPVLKYVGTTETFLKVMNASPSKIGLQTGTNAENALLRLGQTEFKNFKILPISTPYFNKKEGRYIYTEKGGWVDMTHFLFYAGKALEAKKAGEKNPIGEAMQEGYKQEALDPKHSAYSYEDLPSDKFGAEFATKYFDPKSKQTLGEQVTNYLNNVLKATDPKNAPNYNKLPADDSENAPSSTNKTTKPMFTKDEEKK